jgi:EAL domain
VDERTRLEPSGWAGLEAVRHPRGADRHRADAHGDREPWHGARFDAGHRLTGEEVLVNADLAMYDAKEAGRDQLAAYAAAEHQEERLEARMSGADMIRDALAEDRFVLHAQPIVDLASGEVTQYELLLRMRGTDGELITPSAFLPVAERFDLMAAIDRWVVRRAIRMVGDERRRGKRTVAEHVGDRETAALLRRMGVDHAQGFHLGEPAPLSDWLPEAEVVALT